MQLVPKRNRQLQRDYVFTETPGGCELFHHLEGETWDKILASYGYPNPESLALEPHHIFGGPHRWDIVTNLLAVCRPVHDWCHRERQSATILGIWVKQSKDEFDRELVRECMGFDPIGVIEYYDVEPWVDEVRMVIFERV